MQRLLPLFDWNYPPISLVKHPVELAVAQLIIMI